MKAISSRSRRARYSRPEGSIIPIKSAKVETYKLKFELPGALPGQRRTAYKTVKGSKEEAKAALRKELERVRIGLQVDAAKQPFAAWVKSWLDGMKAQVSQRTLERYGELLEKHALPYFDKLALGQVSPLHISNLYATLRESGWRGPRPKKAKGAKGLSPRTINHVHRVLSQCFGAAVGLRIIDFNPTFGVKRPKLKKTAGNKTVIPKMKILTRPQLGELLTRAKALPADDPNLPAIMVPLALDSGARPGEYLALRWNDVDYKRRGIEINEAVDNTKADGLQIKDELKTEQSRRFVTLSAATITALKEEQKRQAEVRKEIGRNDSGEEDLIFAHSPAEPYRLRDPDYVSKAFKQFAKGLGFDGLRLYDMRHNCASHMLANGRPVTEVSAHLGHADPSTTLRFYGFAIPRTEPGAGLLDDILT